jgi:hypothetical protein
MRDGSCFGLHVRIFAQHFRVGPVVLAAFEKVNRQPLVEGGSAFEKRERSNVGNIAAHKFAPGTRHFITANHAMRLIGLSLRRIGRNVTQDLQNFFPRKLVQQRLGHH